jgi:ATP diphosphatase
MSAARSPSSAPSLADLVAIMERLRDPETGCSWDRDQTFETIAPYTIEEAYEVADAIERADMAALVDELGDLQLQVVYHARIAEERGVLCHCRRARRHLRQDDPPHPHVFGDAAASPGWEALKAAERDTAEDRSALAGVALALPALKRAEKLQRRAARVGFDWPDASGPRAKIDEELAELASAETETERHHELGDLIFSAVNLARHLNIDPEAALRDANRRFEQRFRKVEMLTEQPLSELDIEALEALWQQAKVSNQEV